ncbi:Adenylate cyclase type 9 [Cichlidogyrus casuarinus]|uniref:adenylate cyclase n=1 Tax=Cichlidogyrus casuarinus TaxID=1844966 RepID=A0ABD2Q550_9PLAT
MYRTTLGILLSLMLFNCTLFTTFSSWTKSLSASSIVLLTIVLIHVPSPVEFMSNDAMIYWSDHIGDNSTYIWMEVAWNANVIWEFTIMLILHLVLIWMLNREFDVSSRTSFNRDCEAREAKEEIAKEKQRADWLLENIIPSYVLTELRTTNKYSRHVVDAGVVFATISNFADFYDEQYQGGQEMLRVLNEIFADFEHQLPRFKNVEKIKTIGACFMAASGLNMTERARNREPDAHLMTLLDFAIELIKVLDEFNRQMFSFKFDLKVGFNVGEVTAGVIGTTKLLYDIWGDTVNVASRMYSTGMKQRIQVTEQVAQRLSQFYEFEYRDEVFVKGKGNMKTYLLVKKK